MKVSDIIHGVLNLIDSAENEFTALSMYPRFQAGMR
jgi:hypothetical protein